MYIEIIPIALLLKVESATEFNIGVSFATNKKKDIWLINAGFIFAFAQTFPCDAACGSWLG
jgi:hypothetical protein